MPCAVWCATKNRQRSYVDSTSPTHHPLLTCTVSLTPPVHLTPSHPQDGPFKCVVKPNESAGTDSVFLCTSEEETMQAFSAINGHANGLGHTNHGALCQEFLSGTEFVIDGVSRDGVYKVTAIWEYDKRSVNGANFVYFGMFCRGAQVGIGGGADGCRADWGCWSSLCVRCVDAFV